MNKKLFLWMVAIVIFACKEKSAKKNEPVSTASSIGYAKGFSIESQDDVTIVNLKNPWPGADKTYRYALVPKGGEMPNSTDFDAIVEIPVSSIVVTSTTHIPSLEMLGVSNTLVGFPNLDYISSEETRTMIDDGRIKELGKNEAINTEVLIDLSPDVVVGFAVDGNNSTFNTIEKTGTPVLYNADWTETHPLGKAEWIKFFGALYGKEDEADRAFNEIERAYQEAKDVAATTTNRPSVLSGAMYKDIWYLPQGDSWAAKFIADANGQYLWAASEGTGSIAANLETVLDKGQAADFWIGPGQFSSLDQMEAYHEVYTQFEAFQQDKVYSFTAKKGATGGVMYYELAPNRPDLVLKDLIKILHPEVLPDYELYFFSKLQ